MPSINRTGVGRVGKRRRLQFEGLEPRCLLAVDWPGYVVGDLNGNLLAVDVEGTGHAYLLGALTVPMYDLAVSSSGKVMGVGGPPAGPSVLYEIPVDYANPGGTIVPQQVQWIHRATTLSSLWINGLEYAPDGTLLATGYDASGINYLYAVNPATASATELVTLGSHRPAGDLTVDEEGTVYTVTFGGNLLAVPGDYSAYSVVGTVGFGNVYGMSYGPGPDLYGYLSDGRIIQINKLDASWTHQNWIWSSTVPSLSTVLGATTAFAPPANLGEVDYLKLTGQSPILGKLWYRLDTMHDGYLTVKLEDLSTTTGVAMVLYREGQGGALSRVADGQTRVEQATAVEGQRYFVEITGLKSDATVRIVNQLTRGTNSLVIHGSAADDALDLAIGTTYTVKINGVDYSLAFPGAALVTTTFSGTAGRNSAKVAGSSGDDTAIFDLTTRSGSVTGPGFVVELSGVSSMEFDGKGGNDTAEILGTDADGQIALAPFSAAITEGTLHAAVRNTEWIHVDAAGGRDHVVFAGTSKAESVTLYPDRGVFEDKNQASYRITTANVETNHVTSGGGGDVAYLRDSPGDETFTAFFGTATYAGPGYAHELHGFREVHAYGLNGGNDRALIYDTTYDDKFKGTEDQTVLRGGGFYFRAKGFENVHVVAQYGGDDLAVFVDTAGNDVFTASHESAQMANGTITYRADGFQRVVARSLQGPDIARLQDSPGNDEFRGRSHKSTLIGPQMDITVRGFSKLYVEAVFGGNDIGKMHDSAGNNHLTASGQAAQMWRNDSGLDLLYEVIAFARVKAYWSTGTNTKAITTPIDFLYMEEYL